MKRCRETSRVGNCQSFPWWLALCLGITGCLILNTSLHAALVTLHFDAKINRVSGLPFDTGFEFAEGDVISGKFAFVPNDGNGGIFLEATQPYGFTLNVNGVNITTTSYIISVANSINTGTVSDSGGVTTNLFDILSLTGDGLSVVDSDSGHNIAPASRFIGSLWRPSLTSPDLPGSFVPANIPGDSATWNQFVFQRQLAVSFRNEHGGEVGFQATIGDFTIVPEPSTCSLTLFFVATFVMVRTRRSRLGISFNSKES